jgi:hypothetical protein
MARATCAVRACRIPGSSIHATPSSRSSPAPFALRKKDGAAFDAAHFKAQNDGDPTLKMQLDQVSKLK